MSIGKKRAKKKMQRKIFKPVDPSKEFEFMEALKTFRTNVEFCLKQRENNRIVVTSAVPMEGKTAVSVNFAITLAQTGAKVVLIEGDMRKPSMHKVFGIERTDKGLSSILSEGSFEEAVRNTPYKNLCLILAGSKPPNPAELMGGKYMGPMLEMLEKKFDYIVIDTPPVNLITDALVIAKYKCSYILVARENYSDHREVKRTMRSLQLVGADIMGGVLVNSSHAISSTKKGGGYYYYGYL